jgi:glycosyltransferase involved in cell wall biosynthesis
LQEKLVQLYPGSSIEIISRAEFEIGNLLKRLKLLRALGPDVLAIATERLQWQRGQEQLMIFGVLAGAREVVLLDVHNDLIRRSRWNILLRAPVKLVREIVTGADDLTWSRRKLLELEREVPTSRGSINSIPDRTHPLVAYLRSSPGPGTQAGGAASHIKGVVEGFRSHDVEVEIISNDLIAGFDVADSRFTMIAPQPVGFTRALFDIHNNRVFTSRAVPLIERARPDFIYQRYARFSWAGVAAAVKTKRPLFLEYNGSEVWLGRHWDRVGRLDLLERYERLNLDAAARIFVVSEVERKNLEARGIASGKIVVNPNGVDVERFRPGAGGGAARRELGLKANEVVAGFVGTFGPWHGVEKLAEAIKSTPANVPVRFLLVGSGALHPEVEKQLAVEASAGRVIFTGSVDHDRVPALLDACDILVAPHVPLADGSEFFGSPTKVFEYMAMGKAIVASRLGQIGEVLENKETALLVGPGNAGELAAAIVKLVESDELRARLGAKAREVAEREFTWKHNAQRVLDAYKSWTGLQD